MNRPDPTLKEMLARLQKPAGLAPPTPAEADAAMEGADEASIDDAHLLKIASAVVRGNRLPITDEIDPLWSTGCQASKAQAEEFAGVFRNRGEDDEETRSRIKEAEERALSDDDDDDQAGLEGS